MAKTPVKAVLDDIVDRGQAQRDRASAAIEEAFAAGRRGTEALTQIVRREVERQLRALGLRPARPAAKKSTAKKTAAKKSTAAKKTAAKKSTAKKTAAKKSTAVKKTAVKKTAAKKTAAKTTAAKATTAKKSSRTR